MVAVNPALSFFLVIMFFSFSGCKSGKGRVAIAKKEKQASLERLLQQKGLPLPPAHLFFRAFKHEKELEVWARDSEEQYTLLKTYKVCKTSGTLGPKRKQGDGQVPEGFYTIDRFNERSRFFLSLGLNYPNESDKILGNQDDPGDNIFIHGDCVSIGCLAMTDDYIKEIYLLAHLANEQHGNKIAVHVFPFRFNSHTIQEMMKQYQLNGNIESFWLSLKKVYDLFEKNRVLPGVQISPTGKYLPTD